MEKKNSKDNPDIMQTDIFHFQKIEYKLFLSIQKY